ncbi:MAG: transcription termination factor Rho, partial [Micrococcales bacterium]|nr:transcription termination factor Rho [Micrococcales bacterium]
MKLAELQALASSMGIKSISRMRKADLIAAIGAARRSSAQTNPPNQAKAEAPAKQPNSRAKPASAAGGDEGASGHRDERTARAIDQVKADLAASAGQRRATKPAGSPGSQGEANQGGQRQGEVRHREDDAGQGTKRRRGRDRYRDRKSRSRPSGGQGSQREVVAVEEAEVREDDVLVPVAGILDVLDNYAFVRTSGYLPGPGDVYVSLSQVRKVGLREGDAIVGAVRQPREGEQSSRQKYNALVRIDSVNGRPPSEAANRLEFAKLTPLYPQERLRLETEPENLTTRVIDLVAPIGKGQRGLIVSPAKAGKTMIMQAIANAVTTNNPEVHLMVVLVDERPEEVTDFERSVKGEVISSTFDRPASDHTLVAELAIERAKRLVEMGHDVLILLDGITRLGRAYNLAAPASGRILSGGVDSSALYPPKKF